VVSEFLEMTVFLIFSLFCFSTIFFSVLLQIVREINLRRNSPREDTSLRPHTIMRPPTTHLTILCTPPSYPTTPYLLIPTPTSRTPHHTITPSTQRERDFSSNCVPQIFLSEKLPHGLTAAWHFGVWIPNLGALPTIASVSFTHNPSLFACLHESMSCVYVFFSTCLSIYVLCAACLVFCKYSFHLFQFQNIQLYACRCTHNILYMTLFVPSTSLKNLFTCARLPWPTRNVFILTCTFIQTHTKKQWHSKYIINIKRNQKFKK